MADDLLNANHYYDKINAICTAYFRGALSGSLLDVTSAIMSLEGFPMHHPLHHYIVPAVLLSACRRAQGQSLDRLERDLKLAEERSKNVLGGFCGYYGACGAAVGTGIFWCILTDCSPMSADSWAYGNYATGNALLEMARIGGPRCCKRTVFIALNSVVAQVEEVLNLSLDLSDQHSCRFSERNQECLHERCAFYSEEKKTIEPPQTSSVKRIGQGKEIVLSNAI